MPDFQTSKTKILHDKGNIIFYNTQKGNAYILKLKGKKWKSIWNATIQEHFPKILIFQSKKALEAVHEEYQYVQTSPSHQFLTPIDSTIYKNVLPKSFTLIIGSTYENIKTENFQFQNQSLREGRE